MRVILCLSEAKELEFCKKRIAELAKTDGIDVTVEAVGYRSARDIRNKTGMYSDADLFFLGSDSSLDGVGIAAALREAGIRADIVFLARSGDRVFEAFDVDALHFLLTDRFSKDKFDAVFRKAEAKAEARAQASIVLSCAGEQRRIPISQIRYFEVINRIVTVHYAGGTFEFYSTLSRIEDTLTRKGFVRVHRSYLVARKLIVSVSRSGITLTDGTHIPVGGKYAANLDLY